MAVKHLSRGRRALLAALAAGPLTRLAAATTRFPEGPVRLVVPFAAGTVVDVYARLLATPMAERLGQPLVVDNIPGAGGTIGVERVARARPDGSTIVFAGDAAIVVGQALNEALPYDPVRDLAPISQLLINPTVLVVAPEVPVRTVAELVAHLRREGGRASFASAGMGTASHRAGEMLRQHTGLDFVHVPYNASPVVDVMQGRVTLFFAPMSAMQHVRAGKLRPLAVTGAQRSTVAPDVPTMIEAGFAGFEASAWFGLLAPARTPDDIVARLHAEARACLQSAAVSRQLDELGALPVGSTPAEFRALIAAEIPRWAGLLKRPR